MPPSDDMPTLAGLRRNAKRKRAPETRGNKPSQTLSLFDFSQPTEQPLVTPQDILNEQLRSLNAPAPAPTPPPPPLPPRVWTIAALVNEVRSLVERSYGQVTVEGEISNWRAAGSGHCYFTLKDGDAQLAAVMFRRNVSLLRFRPKDGDAVRVRGQISVYAGRGQMQIIVESMQLAGQGALLAAVQELKERLRREGLFNRKRPLPAFPACIGVITSVRGAALRDIVKVCRRRHAAVNLLVYPASVQGPRCVPEVIAGLRWFSAHPERADVVIVARGGGSWEDLHGFDDEGVSRAMVACTVPVIAGIGHATDTTIADAAADVCVPTPSAAAELVTEAQHRAEERLERLGARVLRAGSYELMRARQRLWAVGTEAALRRTHAALRTREQRVDELGFRTEAAASRVLRERTERLSRLETRLRRQDVAFRLAENKQKLERARFRLERAGQSLTLPRHTDTARYTARLHALSPLRVLERGYALVYSADGSLLRSSAGTQEGELITARLAQGSLQAQVTAKD